MKKISFYNDIIKQTRERINRILEQGLEKAEGVKIDNGVGVLDVLCKYWIYASNLQQIKTSKKEK